MTTDLKPRPTPDAPVLLTDRRRPGPRVPVSPELIPLLRGYHRKAAYPDSLDGARGVAFAVLACAAFWVVVLRLF